MATVKSQVTLTEETAAALRAMDARGRLSEGIENMYRDFKRGALIANVQTPHKPHHKPDLSDAFNVDEPAPVDPRNPTGHKGRAERLRREDEAAALKAKLPELNLRSHIRTCLTQDLGERWMQSALEAAEMPMVQARAILADVLANESETIAMERAKFRAGIAAHEKKMKDAEDLYKQRVAGGMDAQQALIQGTHELGLKTAEEQAASEPSYADWLKQNPIEIGEDDQQ